MTKRSPVLIWIACFTSGWLNFGCYQPYSLVREVQKQLPDVLFYVPTESNHFALTFDDGPNPPCTDKVLEILAEHKAIGNLLSDWRSDRTASRLSRKNTGSGPPDRQPLIFKQVDHPVEARRDA